uniref:Uncharacterized protein n=1 Tax=Pundamilia nyererei TaxID=303518 RepID=A0A3B4GN97_9CICH
MTEQTAAVGHKVGKPMLHNWVEERAIADLHTEDPKTHKHIHGHKGILTIDLESKMESVTTLKAAYVAPKTPVGRLQGMCLYLSPARMKKNYIISLSYKSLKIFLTFYWFNFLQVHDYKTDQAITFWSENCQRIQGVTAARSSKGPFRKSALFSTPITERLDEIDLPPDN